MNLLSDRNIKRILGRVIWEASETLHIPLGRFALIVFGWIIGSKGKEVNKKSGTNNKT